MHVENSALNIKLKPFYHTIRMALSLCFGETKKLYH